MYRNDIKDSAHDSLGSKASPQAHSLGSRNHLTHSCGLFLNHIAVEVFMVIALTGRRF